MNIKHVNIIHAVYSHSTLTAAARALNISQPAVTQTLQHAEQQLGFPLFLREKSRLIPTEDAHALFPYIEGIYRQLETLRQVTRNMKQGRDTTLRISTLPSLSLSLMPKTVAAYLAKKPDTFFDLQTVHHDEIAKKLFERLSEVVIAYEKPTEYPLSQRRLGEGELGILYREAEFPDAPPRIGLECLADHPFVSLMQSGPLGLRLAAEFDRLGLSPIETVSVGTFYVAAELVRAGVGMAVIDSFTAQAAVGQGLSFRPLDPAVTFDVHAIWLESRPPTTAMSNFLKVITAAIPKL